jgi:hypothetical protein
MRSGKKPEYRRAVADSIHRALVETIKIPEKDRFQIISEHAPSDLIYDPSYLDISRSDDVLLVQVTLSTGRSVELKKALYARMVELLAASPGIRKQDLFVSLVDVAKENWSFGNGVAQYA